MSKITAVILSGGVGSRMQETIPKQYLLLAGKPMIMHTVERLDSIEDIDKIIIVCDMSYVDSLKEMMKEYNITTPVEYVNAGMTRQESVYNGVKNVTTEYMILHEAARPFVKTAEFRSLVNDNDDNVTFGYDIPYTVVQGHGFVEGVLNRSELINVQLPQKFKTKELVAAHEKAILEGNAYTEDASLIYKELNLPVKVIKGSSYNIKITEPIDLLYGEIIYRTYFNTRR